MGEFRKIIVRDDTHEGMLGKHGNDDLTKALELAGRVGSLRKTHDGIDASDETGERIRVLGDRIAELENQIGGFFRARLDRDEIAKLEALVTELEGELEALREEEKTMDRGYSDAGEIRKSCDDQLDALARAHHERYPALTFEQAYVKVLATPHGGQLLDRRDDAQALLTGRPTMREVAKHASTF